MGHLKTSHIVETAIWLVVIVFFYYHSFAFDKEIEIYRYGASAWPRAILLMMALVFSKVRIRRLWFLPQWKI